MWIAHEHNNCMLPARGQKCLLALPSTILSRHRLVVNSTKIMCNDIVNTIITIPYNYILVSSTLLNSERITNHNGTSTIVYYVIFNVPNYAIDFLDTAELGWYTVLDTQNYVLCTTAGAALTTTTIDASMPIFSHRHAHKYDTEYGDSVIIETGVGNKASGLLAWPPTIAVINALWEYSYRGQVTSSNNSADELIRMQFMTNLYNWCSKYSKRPIMEKHQLGD